MGHAIQNVWARIKERGVFDLAFFNAGLNQDIKFSARRRSTIAEVNAVITLLPAIPGFKYRIVDITLISIGGAGAGLTTLDVLGTQAGASVKLVAVAAVGLGQSIVNKPFAANNVVLADGASFVANDANTAITLSKTGAALTGSVSVDAILEYVLEEA